MTDDQIGEKVAAFFTEITDEYSPISRRDILLGPIKAREKIEPYQIAARLRTMKKPESLVPGDIFPQLVSVYSDLLAVPLGIIYITL